MGYIGRVKPTETTSEISRDLFVGDNSTVSFTLSRSPKAEEDVIVTIDGVVQQDADYTVSDVTLTFAVAPTTAAKIEARVVSDVGISNLPPDNSIQNKHLAPQAIDRGKFQTFNLGNSPRQTVLSGGVDVNGFPNYVSTTSGLTCDIAGTTTPVTMSFSGGYDSVGAVDYIGQVTSDVGNAWSGLTANATNYLYVDRDSITGALTYGVTKNLPPVYGDTYLKADGSGKAYSTFDGADTATAFTDANGNAWTFNGNAQLDTAQKKFGTASLLLDGTGDYLEDANLVLHAGENEGGFEISTWFRLNAVGVLHNLFGGGLLSNKILVRADSTNVMTLFLGDGSTWSIANDVQGSTVLSISTWYKVRLVWDGATYKVYLSNNGAAETEEISVTSAVAFASEVTGIRLGATSTPSQYINGWIDDFSYQIGPQTLATETPLSSAQGGLPENNEHWFDMNTMKMKYWDQPTTAYIEKQRVFVGEAVTDGSSVTSVINYALKGQYDSGAFDVVAGTKYTKLHNIGSGSNVVVSGFSREESSFKWGKINRMYSSGSIEYTGPSISFDRLNVIVDYDTTSGDVVGTPNFSGDDTFSSTSTTGEVKLIVKRGW